MLHVKLKPYQEIPSNCNTYRRESSLEQSQTNQSNHRCHPKGTKEPTKQTQMTKNTANANKLSLFTS